MAGLDPAIPILGALCFKIGITGTSPVMTTQVETVRKTRRVTFSA